MVVRTDFHDFNVRDTMIASARKTSRQAHCLRTRVSVEEQRAETHDRFLRGRQIAYMICVHFHAKRDYEAVQGLKICSIYAFKMTTPKTSTFDGIKLYYQRAKCYQMWCWKHCASQNYRTLFSFRFSWLCAIKKPFEIMGKQIICF